jgi:hypothetical protein
VLKWDDFEHLMYVYIITLAFRHGEVLARNNFDILIGVVF